MSEATLNFENPPSEPLPLVESWLNYAIEHSGLPNPNAMALSTMSQAGHPNSRIVLLKGIDERGPVFFTNRESIKGQEISGHPHVALLFHWDSLERQIRIEGTIEPTTEKEDDAYSDFLALSPSKTSNHSTSRTVRGSFSGRSTSIFECKQVFSCNFSPFESKN